MNALGHHVCGDVLGEHGHAAAAGHGLRHPAAGHRGHVGHHDRDGGAAAIAGGQVHVEPGRHGGLARHEEHVAVGRLVLRGLPGKESHVNDSARTGPMLTPCAPTDAAAGTAGMAAGVVRHHGGDRFFFRLGPGMARYDCAAVFVLFER